MKRAFTLAEVLITLAIIGVVAALTIPSVIINAREQGNITAFKKAVSVLNSAIALSVAVDSAGPSATVAVDKTTGDNLITQLAAKMNVISKGSTTNTCTLAGFNATGAVTGTCHFTTADGMQYILADPSAIVDSASKRADSVTTTTTYKCNGGVVQKDAYDSCTGTKSTEENSSGTAGVTSGCTTSAPCFLVVDVNGDGKPNKFTGSFNSEAVSGAVTDRFVIAIGTDGAKPATTFDNAVMKK